MSTTHKHGCDSYNYLKIHDQRYEARKKQTACSKVSEKLEQQASQAKHPFDVQIRSHLRLKSGLAQRTIGLGTGGTTRNANVM